MLAQVYGRPERALLCVAYDMMARRSELVAFNRGDFKFLEDGSGRALIRRSKTDQAGEGHTAYLARVTVRYIQAKHVLDYLKTLSRGRQERSSDTT